MPFDRHRPTGAVEADARSPMRVADVRCGQCGYILDGLLGLDGTDLRGISPAMCPECAQPFNPFAPYRPLSRTQWATFLLIACAPQAGLLALAWGMSLVTSDGARAAIGVAAPMWVGLLLYAVLVWPGLWGALMGKDRVPRERGQLIARAYLCALAPLAILVLTMVK